MPDLVLTMSETARQALDLLKRRLNLDPAGTGDAELINVALSFLDWGTGEIEAGRMVGSIDLYSKNFTEAASPQFEALKQQITWAFWNQAPSDADQDQKPPIE